MNFDLRLPIGIMFTLFGAILTIFGAVSDKAIYEQHSLGINVNLYWGLVLLVFASALRPAVSSCDNSQDLAANLSRM